MGQLKFVGLGLHSELGISLRGLDEAKGADLVLAELYTSLMPELSLERLERLLGKPVKVLSRSDVEEKAEQIILNEAKTKTVAFLVPGDPMAATTHLDLRLRAEKAGIKTGIVHGASVTSAVSSVIGLQNYKFGRTVTIPIVEVGTMPESPYDFIKENLYRGLHTLVLLDIKAEEKTYMTIPQAVKKLLVIEEERKENVITNQTLAVGVARIGAEDMKIKAGSFERLQSYDFGGPPHSLVIPGKLHFMEAEALQVLAGAERRDLEEHLGEVSCMTEDAKERSRRYMAAVETALSELKPLTMPAIIARRDVERIVEVAKRYLSDSKYYVETGKDVTSLASISYAEGLLDALRFLKLVEFSSPQELKAKSSTVSTAYY